jgi:diguanylate cyclase (GGDEF)-like protein
MDYRTLFISDLTSLVIYTTALCALALANPRIRGLRWFAVCLISTALKVALQSVRGLHPIVLTNILGTLIANEINDLSFLAIYLGYRWFIVRKPLKSWWAPGLILAIMAIYPAVFYRYGRWSFAVGMLPVFIACGLTTVLLLRNGNNSYLAVARAGAVLFVLQIIVAGHRTVLVTSMLMAKGTGHGVIDDPRWLISMMVLSVLTSLFVGSFLWLYVIEFQATLRHQARTDTLTGALNRGALDIEAEREIARCYRNGLPLSIIVLDIDFFKHLNDARGHDAGDAALRALVNLLHSEVRSQDVVARCGGEEFLILLPEAPLSRAREIAERLRAAIERMTIPFDGLPICITASFGVADLQTSQQDTWETMRRRGDLAMYTAKRLGRNRVIAHTAFEQHLLLNEPNGAAHPQAAHPQIYAAPSADSRRRPSAVPPLPPAPSATSASQLPS